MPVVFFMTTGLLMGQITLPFLLQRKRNTLIKYLATVSVLVYRYEMDSSNLVTHTYLLLSGTNSWLQNKAK